jgi:hypothetical protein
MGVLAEVILQVSNGYSLRNQAIIAILRSSWLLALACILGLGAHAQSSSPSQQTDEHAGMNMPTQADSMQHMGHELDLARDFLMRESSGTAFQPSAWPMPMIMTSVGQWRLMWMAQAFLVDTQQTGPLGADKFYSTNWGMLSALHRLGGGDVMLRTMLSLEPATVSNEFYPLLFQTGETAYGKPIVNGQHPHDLVMELSVQYAHRLGQHAVWDVYCAPVGDPALGPVAYPHRASALEIPQSTLGHHWEDSTHILYNVVTAGMSYRAVRLEASGFHGAEPDENRWNIDFGPMNSYAARLTVTPAARWVAQFSAGHLVHPEALEPGDVVRTTASVEYTVPRPHGNAWATTLLWGRNGKQAVHYGTNAVLAETVVPFNEENFVSGRYEWSQRDELFANDPALAQRLFEQTGSHWFDVSAYTIGYTRDIGIFHNVETGLGANVSLYGVPDAIKPYYGDHPLGVNVYLRLRLKENR